MQETPVSLLERLRCGEDEAAWNRFVDLYTPLLYQWTRRLGLNEADAAEVVQDVFVVLVRELPHFRRRKRFRGWLWTILINTWRARQRRGGARRRAEIGSEALDGVTTPDSTEIIEETEYRQYLVARALDLMQAEFHPATWKACYEYVVGGRPAPEVAAELGITVNAVYLAKSRVLRRLRQELEDFLE